MRTKHTPAVRGHITADAARRIAIRAQGLAQTADRPKTPADVLRRVAAVQLDTISILARSHELVTYARAGAVGRPAVEDAYWGRGQAFEYHAHANCILPIESWPYFAFRRRSFRAHRWAHPPANAYREVQARLREGPVTVTDTIVSHATRDSGSFDRNRSTIASLIWSATLSGWPSETDSDVKR